MSGCLPFKSLSVSIAMYDWKLGNGLSDYHRHRAPSWQDASVQQQGFQMHGIHPWNQEPLCIKTLTYETRQSQCQRSRRSHHNSVDQMSRPPAQPQLLINIKRSFKPSYGLIRWYHAIMMGVRDSPARGPWRQFVGQTAKLSSSLQNESYFPAFFDWHGYDNTGTGAISQKLCKRIRNATCTHCRVPSLQTSRTASQTTLPSTSRVPVSNMRHGACTSEGELSDS